MTSRTTTPTTRKGNKPPKSKGASPTTSGRARVPHRNPSGGYTPPPGTRGVLVSDSIASRNGGLEEMRKRIVDLTTFLTRDPLRKAGPRAIEFLKRAIAQYENAVKASIGMPGFSDCVTTQHEAPKDVPTVPLQGYQLIKRVCYIPKLANLGTTVGGFYASLFNGDVSNFVGPQTYFRVSKITSWTVPRQDGNANQATFAGVSVPVQTEAQGTENLPIWSENFTPVGQGFAGIVTQFPLGDFPQYSDAGAQVLICNHFTSLGGTGGVTNVPVVFHVEIETLI
jgi:hypothetical protein